MVSNLELKAVKIDLDPTEHAVCKIGKRLFTNRNGIVSVEKAWIILFKKVHERVV